jgi:hypothetical protein
MSWKNPDSSSVFGHETGMNQNGVANEKTTLPV